MELKKATRVGIRPLIGLYSESGCGKTMSALLLARGFVGKDGVIGMVDSESGRGSLYADVIPGGYQVLDLTAPFSSARYIEAINIVSKKAEIGVLDSGSHEHEGIGGMLDMATAEEARGMKGLGVWAKPKMEHAKFMLALLQSPIPWIICLRAKYKSRQGRNEQTKKTEIIKDDHTTPIQSEAFIYEMTVHGEIMQNHAFHLSKCSHPDLLKCLPTDGMIEIKHGELLRQWCDAPTSGAKVDKPKAEPGKVPPKEILAAMKKKLWAVTETKHQGDPKALEQWLWDEAIIGEQETLAKLDAVRLQEVIEASEKKVSAECGTIVD